MSPSTIDKMFEIYTFFENTTEIYNFGAIYLNSLPAVASRGFAAPEIGFSQPSAIFDLPSSPFYTLNKTTKYWRPPFLRNYYNGCCVGKLKRLSI